MTTFRYRTGAEKPDLLLPWQEQVGVNSWSDLDLSTGYTFTLTLTNIGSGAVALTKTTGLTGQVGSVLVAWAAGELALAVGIYRLDLRATNNSLDRDYSPGRPVLLEVYA